ncbi:MAG: T9SS type A sorting domain-containing protein [Sporocytophaga sp.]|uniref:T9SS type A sorting domain-containing protein n=1 Tax=Sporocytophaga sp. TaxID=2231183 RepID=UPI001AFE2773|nr:T9SS type A sorting domain-containing protein [Sporocytophaga sp.]MBO9699239.1 T9SS type A sorting domain-containing protein [Sporocytophaga sp.]
MKKSLLLLTIILTAIRGFGQNLQISGGNDFSAAVCENQTVFVWGENSKGQLGISLTDAPFPLNTFSNTPVAVRRGNIDNNTGGLTYGNLPAISQVDAGSGAHVLGLSCAGQVWAWGEGALGQLGRGSLVNSGVPTRVSRGLQASKIDAVSDPNGVFLHDIFYVSGGNASSFALEKVTRRVLAWGQNKNGQLGDGTTTDRTTPVYVIKNDGTPLDNIIQIEGGDACTYALDAAGNVWSWGVNDGNQLGRPAADGSTAAITAGKVIQGDPLNSGYSATPTPAQFLSNIIQISGGDTHCLALDGKGNVWSFGGDWGIGQLGRGGTVAAATGVYQNDARRVVIPGLTTYATTEAQFLGNGIDGKAVYVSAGQANSAIVMANGKVVTFGARGLFNDKPISTGSGGSIDCLKPGGDLVGAGSLGDGNSACNLTSCDGKSTKLFSPFPVYVKDGSKPGNQDLTGIVSVSDGDAWFYAVSGGGAAYAWGWNRRGELGVGDFVDKCSAVSFTLPSGCSFANPCPGKPNLGPDVVTCPGFSATLNSNIPQTYTSYEYTWEYRAGTSGAWLPLGTPKGDDVTYTPATDFGQYRVTISDDRASVAFLCGPCPVYMDTVTYTAPPSPYITGGCVDAVANKASFYIVDPDNLPIKWYKNLNDLPGTELNPLDTKDSIVVPFTSTNTSATGCARALYAEDKSSISGSIIKTQPCAPDASNVNGPLYTMITSTQPIKLTEVSFFQGSGWGAGAFELRIHPNVIPSTIYCNDCSPAGNYNGPGGAGTVIETTTFPEANSARTWTLTTPYDLPAGTYWLAIKATSGALRAFNCATTITNNSNLWSTPATETNNVLTGNASIVGNNSKNKGGLYNISYTSGPTYSCGRILVCADGSTCPLPVEFIHFSAERQSASLVLLKWSTATEKNAKEFVIERSFDGINFVAVGTLKAAGNSNSQRNYNFTDKNNSKNTSYYRIREVDFNGDITSTEVEPVIGSEASFKYSIVPNPNKGVFKVQVFNAEGKYQFNVVDLLGKEVYVISGYSEGSAYEKEIDLSYLPSGVYLINIIGETSIATEKLIIE